MSRKLCSDPKMTGSMDLCVKISCKRGGGGGGRFFELDSDHKKATTTQYKRFFSVGLANPNLSFDRAGFWGLREWEDFLVIWYTNCLRSYKALCTSIYTCMSIVVSHTNGPVQNFSIYMIITIYMYLVCDDKQSFADFPAPKRSLWWFLAVEYDQDPAKGSISWWFFKVYMFRSLWKEIYIFRKGTEMILGFPMVTGRL